MASRAAQQVLVSGRLVLVANDASKLQELAVICGTVTKSRNPLLVSGSSTEGEQAAGISAPLSNLLWHLHS